MLEQTLVGAATAGLVASIAWRAGALSATGAVAATLTGTAAMAAGWGWGALLIAYFVATSALTRAGAAVKIGRIGSVVEKGGARDAWQVAANGGAFALSALVVSSTSVARVAHLAALVGAGALAAAASDSWSTEIGTWLGGTPRMITSWRAVPPGTSGGVTAWGLGGAVLGAALVAALALAWLGGASPHDGPGRLPLSTSPLREGALIFVAGVVGGLVDSWVGATVQARRHCPACRADSERRVHDCGAATVSTGGWSWMTNDAVNAFATLSGGVGVLALHALGVAAGAWT